MAQRRIRTLIYPPLCVPPSSSLDFYAGLLADHLGIILASDQRDEKGTVIGLWTMRLQSRELTEADSRMLTGMVEMKGWLVDGDKFVAALVKTFGTPRLRLIPDGEILS